jgi:hypothetical protein
MKYSLYELHDQQPEHDNTYTAESSQHQAVEESVRYEVEADIQ